MNENNNISQDRRKFLISGLTLSALTLLGTKTALAQSTKIIDFSNNEGISKLEINNNEMPQITENSNDDFWSQPRVLRLRHARTNERFEDAYWRNGSLDPEGYRKICHFMRDDRRNEVTRIDPRLLDLLCAMQAWVAAYGFNKPFLITSAYRSPRTNRNIEGAARNSMHMHGKAADIVFPDLPVNYMGKLAQHYSAGGVGFYPSRGFVHVDTGRIRSWRK